MKTALTELIERLEKEGQTSSTSTSKFWIGFAIREATELLENEQTYEELEKRCKWETKTRQKIAFERTKLKKEIEELRKAFDIMKSVFEQ